LPRHAFRFPEEVRDAVRQYVSARVKGVDPRRFRQESHYCIALIHGLIGIAYEDTAGFVQFEVTSIDDRGKGAAESFAGADFVITATVSDNQSTVKKAILMQAKLGDVKSMSPSGLNDLKGQIKKMKLFTRSPKVMEIIEDNGTRQPRIISGTNLLNDHDYTSVDFSDYMVRRVLTTLDGDTRASFVDNVQESSLPELRVRAYSSL
jgi:hypothetical protein